MRLRQLYELEVKPGERKGFSLSMKKLETIQLKVAEMQNAISNLKNTPVPDVLKKQMQDLIDNANIEKEKLYSELTDSKSPEIVEGIPANVLKLFKGIDKNCSTIMNAYRETGKFLYRGIRSEDDALYGKPFDVRKAKDSNPELDRILNNALASQGFAARRDNTSFTSGNDSHAGNYGSNVYIFIPKNGFKFHYSEKIRDLVLGYDKLDLLLDPDKTDAAKEIISKNWESLKKYLGHRYNAGELFHGYDIESDFDGLRRASENGDLPSELENLKTLQDLITDEKIIQNFRYNQTDLEGAIKSRHEVMVTGPYYAIKQRKYEEYFKKYLELTKNGIDLTPDSEKERRALGKKISTALGVPQPEFNNGDYVKHKIETVMGEVVNSFYTNDFVQIKNFNDELILVKKSNIKKIDPNDFENFEPGDKVLCKTDGTTLSYLDGKRGEVVSSDKFTVTVRIKKSYSSDEVTIPKLLVLKAKKYDTNFAEKGDSIKVVSGKFQGEYGKITYVSSYGAVDAELNSTGDDISLDKGQFEVVDPKEVPPDPESPFRENDIVQISSSSHKYAGYVGTVLSSTGNKTKVFIVNQHDVNVPTSKIEKISQNKFDSKKFEYESDVVVVAGSYKGIQGYITYTGTNFVEIRTTEGQTIEVRPYELVLKSHYRGEPSQSKIKQEPKQNTDDNIKDFDIDTVDLDFEPLDEPETPKQSSVKFNPGDKVIAAVGPWEGHELTVVGKGAEPGTVKVTVKLSGKEYSADLPEKELGKIK